jgi:hypothetical protein
LQKVELDDDNNKSPLQRREWEGLRGLWSGREGEGENGRSGGGRGARGAAWQWSERGTARGGRQEKQRAVVEGESGRGPKTIN